MRSVFVLIFVAFSAIASATTYYVSSSGSDLADGLSEATPWKTIDKVNTKFLAMNPGDRILFRRGDTFYGTLSILKSGVAGSPITIGAYGTGNEPVITGLVTLSGWTSEGNGIYSAALTGVSRLEVVLVDGKQYWMGQYPNTGFLTYESFNSNLSITDNNLPASPDWTGAELFIRKNYFTTNRATITDHVSQTLYYTEVIKGNTVALRNNFGYIIQNDIRTLTDFGDWYYNSKTGRFYMYFGAQSPGSHIVKAAKLQDLISISSKNYITIQDIHISGCNQRGIYASAVNNLVIERCKIDYIGYKGLYVIWNTTCSDIKVNNSVFKKINGHAAEIWAANVVFTNNLIDSIGLLRGACYAANDGIGLYGMFDNGLIQYNEFSNSGHHGIYPLGNNFLIINNFFHHNSIEYLDAGAIYLSHTGHEFTGQVIKNNIVLNAVGGNWGTNNYNSPWMYAEGIFLDSYTDNVTVEGNTVANCNQGLKLYEAQKATIKNNTLFNNRWQLGFANSNSKTPLHPLREISLNGNIAFSKQSDQLVLHYYSVDNDLTLFGTSDYNFFTRPLDENNCFNILTPNTGEKNLNLAGWQSYTGQDANSQKSPVAITDTSKIDFYYNPAKTNRVIALPKPMIDVRGTKYYNSITLLPYTSAILMPDPNPSQPAIPVYSGSVIENATPARLVITYNMELADIVPAASAFTVLVNSSARNVTGVAISGTRVFLTLASPVTAGNTVTVSYTKPLVNPLQAPSGGQAESFSAKPVANNVGNAAPVYDLTTYVQYRRAVPVTFGEAGNIESISIYHNGGTGSVLLGVYSDQTGSPASRLGVSEPTLISAAEGWQTVQLISPVTVTTEQTVWLSWVFENNPGVRYTEGTPARAQSSEIWSGGMPATFGAATYDNYKYSVYCSFTTDGGETTTKTLGNTEVYGLTTDVAYRRAIPVTAAEGGVIESISIFHNGGTGQVILGIYADQTGSPASRLGVTPATLINSSAGWQTVALSIPVAVTAGQKVWLSWVFESNPGIRYMEGTPARAQSTATWSGGMPELFGPASYDDYKYSVYCTYSTQGDPGTITNNAGIEEVYNLTTNVAYRRAMPVTFTETGNIESISIYHNGGTGRVLLGVYSNQADNPYSLLGLTEATTINTQEGWQTIDLSGSVPVSQGQTVWLAWVFESNPGIRYMEGTPARAQSTDTWPGGLPDLFGPVTYENYKYSVYCTYTIGNIVNSAKDLGNIEVFTSSSTVSYRRAVPVTFSEPGNIHSISVYHDGGTGRVLLGVYSDQSGSPYALLGVTNPTVINTAAGWQTIDLISPVFVNTDQRVWLSWIFETNPGIRYTEGTPARAQSLSTWPAGMPGLFGTATFDNYIYSVYCTYYSAGGESKSGNTSTDLSSKSNDQKDKTDPYTEGNGGDAQDSGFDGNDFDIKSLSDVRDIMVIYPNPTTGSVNISLNEGYDERLILKIYDINGRNIKTIQIEPGINKVSIEEHEIKKGMYIVELKDDIRNLVLKTTRFIRL